MPYNVNFTRGLPQRQYIDPSLIMKNALLMQQKKEAFEDRKTRNALLNLQIAGEKRQQEMPGYGYKSEIADIMNLPKDDLKKVVDYKRSIQKPSAYKPMNREEEMEDFEIKAAIKAKYAGSDKKRLEDDIMEITKKIAGIKSGENIMTEAMGSGRGKAVEGLEQYLEGMLEIYKSKGGDLKRFGKGIKIQEETITPENAPDLTDERARAMAEKFPPGNYEPDEHVRDKTTGFVYKSDGHKWIRVYKIEK